MLDKWRGEPNYRTSYNYNNIRGFVDQITNSANALRNLGVSAQRARLIGGSGSTNLDVQRYQGGGPVDYLRMGGMLPYKAMGGSIFKSVNTDSIPAMLTAGEDVVKRSAVQKFGVDNLEKINSGTYSDGSVYNYNLAVNVKSDADPNKIARVVMSQIKQIDAQRIRGNRI